jgi:hypothetical protein
MKMKPEAELMELGDVKRYRKRLLLAILMLFWMVSPFLLAQSTGSLRGGPADLYDIESIKNMTLSELHYEETERYITEDTVLVILGDWSNGEWATFDRAGNPRTITLHQRSALYIPVGVSCTTSVGLIKTSHEADSVESDKVAEVASVLGIPILAHGEYSIDWDTLGYGSRNQLLAFSLENIVMLNRVRPRDFITGNFFWVLPHTNMCAITLLQRLAEHEAWNVETVGLYGGSKEGFACWVASAVDDRIETASPGGYHFEDFVYGFRCYGTDWNWEDAGPLGPIIDRFPLFYNWVISTPAGEAAEGYFSVEKFKESLYPRFFNIRGDVTLYGMHDADYYPLGAESPFLEGFTERNWRYNRMPNEGELHRLRPKLLLYLAGEALLKSDEEIEKWSPKITAVEVDTTESRKFRARACVSGDRDSVRLWWSHSETRRWNEQNQAPWVSVPMEKQGNGSYRSEWQQAPQDEEVAYYVEVENWFREPRYSFPRRDASPVQFLWRLPEYPVGVEPEESILPADYALSQNYPNPFNVTTTMNYQLPVSNYIKLEVYNILGQKVTTLLDQREQAGCKSVSWDASNVSSGLYFYKLTAGDFTETRRMMLVK